MVAPYSRTYLNLPVNTGASGAAAIDYDLVQLNQVSSALNGGTPNLTAGAAAGTSPTGPTLGTGGKDGGFKVTLTTGTSCATSDTVFTVTFSQAPANSFIVTFSPGNAAAAALSGNKTVYIDTPVGANFGFKVGSTALSDGTQYIWYFNTRTL